MLNINKSNKSCREINSFISLCKVSHITNVVKIENIIEGPKRKIMFLLVLSFQLKKVYYLYNKQ